VSELDERGVVKTFGRALYIGGAKIVEFGTDTGPVLKNEPNF
jgi:hypothetical protein